LDEVLLQRKELATEYDYSISVGFSYTFGSVFSNVAILVLAEPAAASDYFFQPSIISHLFTASRNVLAM